jgi:hypothetical protein
LKLGHDVHERIVSKIIKWFRPRKPPSQTWKTFLKNHMCNTFAADFFVVPTARFQVLYVLIIIRHESRQVVHFNVTRHPTAKWAAQQIVEALSLVFIPGRLCILMVKEGKTLETDAENLAELTEKAQGFAEKQVPVLGALGVV